MEFTNVGGTDLWGGLFILVYGVGTQIELFSTLTISTGVDGVK